MAKIFISYKRSDKERILKIVNKLQTELKELCWMDVDGIESHAQFASVIIKAIDEADVFLFMYSKSHRAIEDYETDWTIRELNYAQERKKRIVFVNIDGTELTNWFVFMFPQKQQVDAQSEDAIAKLIQDIGQWLSVSKNRKRLHSIEENGKYGFVNYMGKVVIPCKWDYAEEFEDGIACVYYYSKEDESVERTEYIDEYGHVLVTATIGEPYSEGLAAVQGCNGKFGYVDKTGQLIIPCLWSSAYSFSEGLAPVLNNKHKLGFIDSSGKLVIPCQWNSEIVSSFYEGLYAVRNDDGKMGYIDKQGNVVIPCVWEETFGFSNGLSLVRDKSNKFGFIDKAGRIVVPCVWDNAGNFCEGLAWVEEDDGNIGFIDETGRILINCEWREAGNFHEGLAPVMAGNEKWGYINKVGQLVISCEWDEAECFSEGVAWVKIADTWRMIDKKGLFIQ